MLKYRYRSLLCKYNRLLVLSFLMVCRYHRRVSWAPLSLLLSLSLPFPSFSFYLFQRKAGTRVYAPVSFASFIFLSFCVIRVFFFFLLICEFQCIYFQHFCICLYLMWFSIFSFFFSFAFTLYASRAYNINYFTLFVLLTHQRSGDWSTLRDWSYLCPFVYLVYIKSSIFLRKKIIYLYVKA